MNIYVNVFNQLTWPRNMTQKLQSQDHKITWIDNCSTYEPLLDYYNTCDHQVIRLPQNRGGTAPWGLLGKELDNTDYFVITDSDYLLDNLPDDWDKILIDGVNRFGGAGGCGLTMLETKIPSQNPAWIADEFYLYPEGNHPARWGIGVQLPDGFINFPVDTSFAVYPPGTDRFLNSATGIRSGRCAVRHAPWHIVLDLNPNEDSIQILMDDEYYNYLLEVQKAGHYTGTTPRMANFIAEYGKRKANN